MYKVTNENLWIKKIKAFLHDPPDKLISISNHELRRDSLLEQIGLTFDIEKEFDLWSSQLQRISFRGEKGEIYDFHRVDEKKRPYFIHTLTADRKDYKYISQRIVGIQKLKTLKLLEQIQDVERRVLKELYDAAKEPKMKYFIIWRLYRDKLKEKLGEVFSINFAEEFVNLPADSRVPDHSIWDHLDISSAIYGASLQGIPGLFLFKISPVQPFIASARKEKDLWAGSHLLSYLTYQAIEEVIERFGPDSIIYPYMRGQPLLDLELFIDTLDKEVTNKRDFWEKMRVANLPNRFLALVGSNGKNIEEVVTEIKNSINSTLLEIMEGALNEYIFKVLGQSKVFANINKKELKEIARNVVTNYFRINTEFIEIPELPKTNFKDVSQSYEQLLKFIYDLGLPKETEDKYKTWFLLLKNISKYPSRPLDVYALMYEILSAEVGYKSSLVEKEMSLSGYKCSMCGKEVAIMGYVKRKSDYNKFVKFWDLIAQNNNEIKKGERLCPMCLLKRYYPKWLSKHLRNKMPSTVSQTEIQFEDVAAIAQYKTLLPGKTYIDLFREHKQYEELVKKVSNLFETIDTENAKQMSKIIGGYKKLPAQLHYAESFDFQRFIRDFNIDENKINKETLTNALQEIQKIIKKINEDISTTLTRQEGKISRKINPPKYFAILVIDGDNMGKAVLGETLRPFTSYVHTEYLNANREVLNDALKKLTLKEERIKRNLTPSVHMAISRALMYFSVKRVREIVEKNHGVLIYSGGDDVLALLPEDTAIRCACEIAKEFNKKFDKWNLLPGQKMSGGILFSHYLNPLRDSIEKARKLEHLAKQQEDKNTLFVGYLKRGGQYTIAGGKWVLFEHENFVKILKLLKARENEMLSPRVIYDVLKEIESVPETAITDFLAYEFSRHLQKIKNGEKQKLARELAECITELAKFSALKNDINKADVMLQKKVQTLFFLIKNLYDSDSILGEVVE
ncbi:MAG: type III-B CRISPR-associated protein Cas10/Cmr2 [Candidatus Odinarchaeota archaeon]|nr:type III-B CRISPR-associated protein Cas10/Cmr2 [Candidatus Odinarchaeota archaeon]